MGENQAGAGSTHRNEFAPLSATHRLIAFGLAAGVLVVVAIVTRSAEAVVTVASAMLFLLVWLSTGKGPDSTRP